MRKPPFHVWKTLLFCAAASVLALEAAESAELSLFPEDGTLRTKTWWISSDARIELSSFESLAALLAPHGIRVRRSTFPYTYLQDVLLFDESGVVLVQPNMESLGPSGMGDLTIGVYNDDLRQTRFSAEDAERDGLSSRTLRGTLVEGGALISGRRANGTPYVLTDTGAIDRASNFLHLSREEARVVVARDLGVSESDLVELTPWSGHLDLSLQAFPNGVILMHDPSKRASELEVALSDPRISEKEKNTLEELLKVVRADPELFSQNILDKNADLLRSKSLSVVRLAGRFSPSIDFFNGTVLRGEDDSLLVVTNRAAGLSSLERIWAERVSAVTPVERERIYFLGRYAYGAGLDCVGVIAP